MRYTNIIVCFGLLLHFNFFALYSVLQDLHDIEEEEDGEEYDSDFEDDAYGDLFGDSYGSDAEGDETWCTNGVLFKDGASSGDVIQGKLGDCWFLGALATLATNDTLIKKMFWGGDAYSEWGIFVCRFIKDFTWHYVIIDDRIPVFDSSKGQPGMVFLRCTS